MSDEELYKIATAELGSSQRRADLWARAVAIASDDHDEARYLYTSLRVDELRRERNLPPLKQPLSRRRQTTATQSATPQPPQSPPPQARSADKQSGNGTGVSPGKMGSKPANTPGKIRTKAKEVALETTADVKTPSSPLDPEPVSVALDAAVDSTLNVSESQRASVRTAASLSTDTLPPATAGLRNNADSDDLDMTGEQDKTLRLNPSALSGDANRTLELVADDREEFTLDDTSEFSGRTSRISLADSDARLVKATATTTAQSRSQDTNRLYAVFAHSDGRARAVKQGLSWPALFFTLPWLLAKKLWGTFLVYLALLLVLATAGAFLYNEYLAGNGFSDSVTQWVAIGFGVLAAVGLLYLPLRRGNQWIERRLQRKGFEQLGTINAYTASDALHNFRY